MKQFGMFLLMVVSSLHAENQINIRGTVVAYVNTQVQKNALNNSGNQELFLKTNKKGLTIALTNDTFGSSILLNNHLLNKEPTDFGETAYFTFTKIGEIIVSKTHKTDTICVTIAAK
jgi:hypothetical protein